MRVEYLLEFAESNLQCTELQLHGEETPLSIAPLRSSLGPTTRLACKIGEANGVPLHSSSMKTASINKFTNMVIVGNARHRADQVTDYLTCHRFRYANYLT